MKPVERKNVCNLISLVATAVATGTIPEAEDYLVNHYQGEDNELVEHSLNVLTSIKNKQEQYEIFDTYYEVLEFVQETGGIL